MNAPEYHKIQSIYKREPDGKRRIIEGEWSLPEFAYLANNEWTFTEKVDGTNIRVQYQAPDDILRSSDGVTFGGRTANAQIPAPLVKRLSERFTPDVMRSVFDRDVVLYGEGYGAGIQKGGGYRADQDFILFDVRIGRWWLDRAAVDEIAQRLGIEAVPIVGRGTLLDAVHMAREGMTSRIGTAQSEGIVARPSVEMLARGGDRIIAKIKTRDFRD